jgi:hypothetical protein
MQEAGHLNIFPRRGLGTGALRRAHERMNELSPFGGISAAIAPPE